jgi:hypothetical protein
MIFGHPLDTVKVKMQTQPQTYPSFRGCIKQIVKHDGLLGLFKGLPPPFFTIALNQAVRFTTFQTAIRAITDLPIDEASKVHLFMAGSIAGMATVPVSTPTDLLKIRLQLKKNSDGGLREMVLTGKEVLRLEGELRAIFSNPSTPALKRRS